MRYAYDVAPYHLPLITIFIFYTLYFFFVIPHNIVAYIFEYVVLRDYPYRVFSYYYYHNIYTSKYYKNNVVIQDFML